MITDSFDNKSNAKINPTQEKNRLKCDACIVTFSHIIEEYVIKEYKAKQCSEFKLVSKSYPIYRINYNGKTFAFYRTILSATVSVGILEEVTKVIDTNKFIVFGGSGCLDKEIVHGAIMIPTEAYRDEGMSYHYAPASDYIKIRNANKVADFMKTKKLPYILGKTWTTDAFYRETENNMAKRKAEGCISVEMECSGMQAVCDFRGLQLYYFLTSGDLLDAPEWDKRTVEGEYAGTQHDIRHFDIAIELADYVTKLI